LVMPDLLIDSRQTKEAIPVTDKPCGAPGITFKVPFLTSFEESLPESSMGAI
jgi:hypothetical protein